MYFTSVAPQPCPPLPTAQGQAAPLPLEVADPPAEEQLAPLPLEVADPLAEDQAAALEQEKARPSSDSDEETGSLTLEIVLDSEDDDIYVSIHCSYFIGFGGRIVFKKEGFNNFLQALSIEVNNLVLITFKERDQELVVIFNLLPQ
ncbi:Receptor-like protein kinase HERK 1 [Hordeum vulgare]|nr:Receptor-like protein kinase HERK 1 [Hordeum vulgare]